MDHLCFFSVLCLLCLCAHLFICALWSPAGKGLTSWLSFVVSNCEFVTFPLVSWVRCGTWLYRFLIFAPLLTFSRFWCCVSRCMSDFYGRKLEIIYVPWKKIDLTENYTGKNYISKFAMWCYSLLSRTTIWMNIMEEICTKWKLFSNVPSGPIPWHMKTIPWNFWIDLKLEETIVQQ